MMKFRVVESHRSNYPDPVHFCSGDTVALTGKNDDEFPGWTWIRTSDGNAGWAPESFLKATGSDSAIALEEYCARELDTETGEVLESDLELNGWRWCLNRRGQEGWVPCHKTERA